MFYVQIRIIAGIQLFRGFRVPFMRIDDTSVGHNAPKANLSKTGDYTAFLIGFRIYFFFSSY